ncbi:MAG: hypothetical protein ACO39Q_10965 [Ilumatobacteraceae bacterium]
MNPLPTLPATFYERSEPLTHIRRAAQSRQVPPDTVLGALLCRLSAIVPPTTRVNHDSPNYFVALVGGSGAGKSTAKDIAHELLPAIGTEIDDLPVSSGEGLVQAYLETEKIDGRIVQRQAHTAGLFYVDEGQQLLPQADRQGSTTFALLRTLWAGQMAGTTGARVETTRRLQSGRYRIALTVGFQPDYAATLLDDHHAGTPQRFLWVAARDPQAPITLPRWPGPLPMPTVISGAITIDDQIQRQIDRARRQVLIDGGHENPLRSHETRLTLRTAYLLAVLHGRPGRLDADDWIAGLELVEHSRSVIAGLQQIASDRRQAKNAERDREQVDRHHHRAELHERKTIERIAANLHRRLRSDGPRRAPELRRDVAYRDRDHFDEAVRYGVETGLVAIDSEGRLIAGPVTP